MKNILLSALALTFALTSCNEWLDVMPDNRAEVDTAEKVEKLLVSAYPENAYIMISPNNNFVFVIGSLFLDCHTHN